LTYADRCGEVDDRVHASEGALDFFPVANIPHDQFSIGGKIVRPRPAAMDLGREVVEKPNGISAREKQVGYV